MNGKWTRVIDAVAQEAPAGNPSRLKRFSGHPEDARDYARRGAAINRPSGKRLRRRVFDLDHRRVRPPASHDDAAVTFSATTAATIPCACSTTMSGSSTRSH